MRSVATGDEPRPLARQEPTNCVKSSRNGSKQAIRDGTPRGYCQTREQSSFEMGRKEGRQKNQDTLLPAIL